MWLWGLARHLAAGVLGSDDDIDPDVFAMMADPEVVFYMAWVYALDPADPGSFGWGMATTRNPCPERDVFLLDECLRYAERWAFA